MKESDVEGLANHGGPESCGGGGNAPAEALTGVSAGPVSSPEIGIHVPVADRLFVSGRQYVARRLRLGVRRLAGSKTRSMRGIDLCGNRETLRPAPGIAPGSAQRTPRRNG
jgi:hypothetical protein